MPGKPSPKLKYLYHDRALETQPRKQLLQLQDRLFRQVQTVSLKSNPFYRAKFRAAGIRKPVPLSRLADLPFTTKSELMADQLAHPPFGSDLAYPVEKYTRLHQTSGTTGVPVRWLEDRRENFIATVGERDQDWDMEMAVDANGRMLALRGRLCHDHGAYTPYGIALAYNAGTNVVGPYVLPAYRLDINWCLTNYVPCAPTRGAGRPQGMYVMERLLDRVAEKLGIARDEVRRRNLIQPSQMPYATPIKQRDGSTMTYDSGDYPESQRRALAAGGWADFPARQSAARAEGRHIGLGLANYVEGTEIGRAHV